MRRKEGRVNSAMSADNTYGQANNSVRKWCVFMV